MQHTLISKEELARFCRRQHILWLALSGSALKGTAKPESDIDLLVEFEPGCEPGLLGLAALEEELSAFLGGGRWICALPGN